MSKIGSDVSNYVQTGQMHTFTERDGVLSHLATFDKLNYKLVWRCRLFHSL